MPGDDAKKQDDKKADKKPAYLLGSTEEYAEDRGLELPKPRTEEEKVIAERYDDVSAEHLFEAGSAMYKDIVAGKDPYVKVVNDALENPVVRKKLNPATAKIIIIENGCNPNLVDGAYLNEENVKSAVAKMEEREQWLGDREAEVMKREKELDAAERADPTKPNANITCDNCGNRVPVGKKYQDKMTEADKHNTELAERERIVDMGRKETEALRKETEAREKAAKDNEYFVGREKLEEAGWKDEAELGTYLEIMKPDVEPVTTESSTLKDGGLFKKAELVTDSKIIGVKSAKPIKIEKRDEFFVTWQQKIDHYAAHIEIWADMIADKADEKYAESYLKMVLEDVDAAADCAKHNDFVKAYEHLEKTRKVPPPPGRRSVAPPAPLADGDGVAAEIEKISIDDILAGLETDVKEAEKPKIETEENYEMFSYYVEKLVEDSKAEGITIHPAVFSAELMKRAGDYKTAFDRLEQAQKYHERYLAEKKGIAEKEGKKLNPRNIGAARDAAEKLEKKGKDESGPCDMARYEGKDLDLLFGGPKLTAEQAEERMRHVLGGNYDERIKITGDTDGTTLAKVVTHVDIPMGTPAARELETFLRERQEKPAIETKENYEPSEVESVGLGRRFINYMKEKFTFGKRPAPMPMMPPPPEFEPEGEEAFVELPAEPEEKGEEEPKPAPATDEKFLEYPPAITGGVYAYTSVDIGNDKTLGLRQIVARACKLCERDDVCKAIFKEAEDEDFKYNVDCKSGMRESGFRDHDVDSYVPLTEKAVNHFEIKVEYDEEDGQPKAADVDLDALEKDLKKAEEEMGIDTSKAFVPTKIVHKDGETKSYGCSLCDAHVKEENDSCPECGTTFVGVKNDVQPDPAAAVETFGKDFNKSLDELKENREELQKDIDNDFKKYVEPKKAEDGEHNDTYVPAATNAANETPSILQGILDEITNRGNTEGQENGTTESETSEEEDEKPLKATCDECGRKLKPRWSSCPYCGLER